ncbi:MAG: hypothetical protein GY711_35135 [bacterium]|nr:hypothetical protein [bacterium]
MMRSLSLSLLLTATAHAQTYDVVLESTSTAKFQAGIDVVLPGSLIGDFDSKTNPRGTRTLPGLFGGSGNQPVDVGVTIRTDTDITEVPTGSFTVAVDEETGALEIEALSLDALGGGDGATDLIFELLFQTFRTFNPDSLFIGGIPLPIPVGQGTVRNVLFAQSGASQLGVLAPTKTPGTYTFTVLVPVDTGLQLDVFGQVFDLGPIPLTLPLAGTLVVTPDALDVDVSVSFSDMQSIPDPLPGFEIEDLPFGLPTILPPGNTANVLFSLIVASIETNLSIQIELDGAGVRVCGFEKYCTAEVNSTGVPASINALGSADVADADLTLRVEELPLQQFGIFLMSETRTFVPAFGGGDGNLCVGPQGLALTSFIQSRDQTGVVVFAVPFEGLPGGTTIEPGSTWNFQYWFRDRNPAPTSNLSDAIEVRFCE